MKNIYTKNGQYDKNRKIGLYGISDYLEVRRLPDRLKEEVTRGKKYIH